MSYLLKCTASGTSRGLRLAPYVSLAFSLMACGPHPLDPSDSRGNAGGGYGGLAGSAADYVGLGPAGASGYGGPAGALGGQDFTAADGSAADNLGPDATSDGGQTPYRVLAVVTGLVHACALLDDHNVKCWGDNAYGQLGYGDTRDRGSTPADMGNALPTVDLGSGHTAIKIAAGAYDTCAILDDSTLKCWGLSPLNGQPSKGDIGGQPGEMGDALAALSFGGHSHNAVNVSVGSAAACASLDDNTVWCWTDAAGPQMVTGLPSKSIKALSPIENEVVALYDDGTISNELPLGPAINLDAVSNQKILAISGTQGESCAVLDDGTITCMEDLATKTIVPAVAATSVSVAYLGAVCALFADGSVRCPPNYPGGCSPETAYWCDPNGTIALGQGAAALTNGGQGFTCALLADGGIKCWNYGGPIPAWLGSGVALLSGTSASVEYGPWNEIDLGSPL